MPKIPPDKAGKALVRGIQAAVQDLQGTYGGVSVEETQEKDELTRLATAGV